MPTHQHTTLACFDCKRVGSVPASDSSLPGRHPAPTGPYCTASGLSQWAPSGVTQMKPSRTLLCQTPRRDTVARASVAWAVQAETLASTEPPLIIWSPSHAIHCQKVFDPNSEKMCDLL
jgi:hypothetical protein